MCGEQLIFLANVFIEVACGLRRKIGRFIFLLNYKLVKVIYVNYFNFGNSLKWDSLGYHYNFAFSFQTSSFVTF